MKCNSIWSQRSWWHQ